MPGTQTAPPVATTDQPTSTAHILPTWMFRALLVVTIAPVVVATSAAVRSSWWPTSDLALEYLRTTDVGTAHTPLVGAYSRFTFNHPGPAMFYVFAPFCRVLGPMGMFVATGVMNAACMVGTVVVARRRAGDLGALLASAMCLLLVASMGAELSIDPWNPSVPMFPFLFAVICAWAVCDGDARILPFLVAASSYAFQAHLGYGGLVAVLGIAPTVALVVRHRRASLEVLGRHRRSILISAVILVVFWLPPTFQQVRNNPGNLVSVWRNLTQPHGTVVGAELAAKLVAAAIAPLGSWLRVRGAVSMPVFVPIAPIAWLAVIGAVALVLGIFAARRGATSARRLAVLVVALGAAAVWSTAHIQGLVAGYLVRWFWVLGAVTWFSIIYSLLKIISQNIARSMADIAVVVLLIAGLALIPKALTVKLPARPAGVAVRRFANVVSPRLDPKLHYELEWNDDQVLLGLESGFQAQLEAHGRTVLLPWSPIQPYKVGAARVVRHPDEVDTALHVYGTAGALSDIHPPKGERVLLRYDPVPLSLRDRRSALSKKIAVLDAKNRRDFIATVGNPSEFARAKVRIAQSNHRLQIWQDELDRLDSYDEAYLVTLSPPK